MNTPPLLFAALALLLAIGVALWAWLTMLSDEAGICRDAGLQRTDFDIGTWPASARTP